MANDLIKGAVKVATALVSTAFAAKVGKEGKKNLHNWREKSINQSKTNR